MKKLLLVMLGVLFLSPVVFADNWGVGVKLGLGENDPTYLENLYNDPGFVNKELDKDESFAGLEAMYEWDLNAEENKLGVRLGVDFFGENEVEFRMGRDHINLKETTYAFPLSVYYKRDNGINKLSYYGGVGVTLINTEMEEDITDESKSNSKVFPHILAGVEYRFTKLFALGFEAKYNIGAKVKKDGIVLSDRSGFSGALTGRFYF